MIGFLSAWISGEGVSGGNSLVFGSCSHSNIIYEKTDFWAFFVLFTASVWLRPPGSPVVSGVFYVFLHNFFLMKKNDFRVFFSSFYGQRSVTAAWATPSPWSILILFVCLLCRMSFYKTSHFHGDSQEIASINENKVTTLHCSGDYLKLK